MAEYDIDFARELIDLASHAQKDGLQTQASIRLVIYVALLACEISMKAILERAGFTPNELKSYSHDLSKLSNLICFCEIKKKIGSRYRVWVPAVSSFRCPTIRTPDGTGSTIGSLLERLRKETSNYPDEVRYGESFIHYPPQVVLKMAQCIHRWCINYWSNIRRNQEHIQQNIRKRRR